MPEPVGRVSKPRMPTTAKVGYKPTLLNALPNPDTNSSLLIAGLLLLFGQRLVPNVLAKTKLRTCRFGFALLHLAALVQELLNKRIIGGFFGDMFHEGEASGCERECQWVRTTRRVGF